MALTAGDFNGDGVTGIAVATIAQQSPYAQAVNVLLLRRRELRRVVALQSHAAKSAPAPSRALAGHVSNGRRHFALLPDRRSLLCPSRVQSRVAMATRGAARGQ
jgi:hypothetical protein